MKSKTYLRLLVFTLFSIPLLGQDFEVAPVLMSFNANPGEIQTQKLTVRNHANFKEKFVFNLADYSIDENGSKKSTALGNTEQSLADWVTVNPSFVELNPNESFEVEVNMVVPSDGYATKWGMIQVQQAKEQEAQEADKDLVTGVVVVPRIVVLVKQSPRSNNNYRARVNSMTEVEPNLLGQKKFELIIENTGDKIIDAKVYLVLANIETGKEETFPTQNITVYPKYERKLELVLPVKLTSGKYALAGILDYGHRQPIEGAQLLLEIK